MRFFRSSISSVIICWLFCLTHKLLLLSAYLFLLIYISVACLLIFICLLLCFNVFIYLSIRPMGHLFSLHLIFNRLCTIPFFFFLFFSNRDIS